MPAPVPEETRQAIADAIRAGGTCRGIARDFEVSPSTVAKIADEFGIENAFDRSQTAKATEAKTADMAARRAALAAALLDDAEHLRTRARAEYRQLIATRDDVHEMTLPEPPLSEVKHAFSALGIAVTQHLALIKHDTGDGGVSAVDQWLNHMLGASTAAAEILASVTPPPTDEGGDDE